MISRRVFAAGSAALSFAPLKARAQLFNPGAPTLAARDGLFVGDAAPVDPDVVTWAAAVVANGGTVSDARIGLVSAMVAAWKAAGTWTAIDDAFPLVAENAPQALTSLKQRRLGSAINSPTFTVDRGYAFNGTTQYIDTLFTPSTHAVAMTGTNLHISVYERTNLASNTTAVGAVNSSTQNLQILPRGTTNLLTVQLNSQATGPGGDATVTDSRGLSVGSRNGTLAADILAYRNGVAVVPNQPGTLGVTLPTVKIYIGCRSDNANVATAFRPTTLGFVSVGAGIPAAQQPDFYNALQSYMTAVGANV